SGAGGGGGGGGGEGGGRGRVLRVEAQMAGVAPRAPAMLTATVMPRSLNDPVGLAPSTFRYTSHPVRADTTGAGSRGVAPSPSVITGVPAGTGRRPADCLITPAQVARAAGARGATRRPPLPRRPRRARRPPPP